MEGGSYTDQTQEIILPETNFSPAVTLFIQTCYVFQSVMVGQAWGRYSYSPRGCLGRDRA